LQHSYQVGEMVAHQARNRKARPTSEAIKREARRLKAHGRTWPKVAEAIWTAQPDWFPNDQRPEELRDRPHQRAELLSRLAERIRALCRYGKKPAPEN
jgi:hypothetical protein